MADSRHSTIGVITSTLEVVLLVFLGVVVANLGSILSWVVLLITVGVLVFIRYIAGARARQDESRTWLNEYLEDPSNLQETINEISSRGALKENWTKRELITAISWWFDEDLYTDLLTSRHYEEETSRTRLRASLMTRARGNIDRWFRHPIRSIRTAIIRMERRLVQPSSDRLISAVADLPFEEVAQMVIKHGKEKGFLIESAEPGPDGRPQVVYAVRDIIDLKSFYEGQIDEPA